MKEMVFENGIQYSLHGDYYLPNLKLEPETRPIGRWGRMHRDYLKDHRPVVFNQFLLSGKLWTYLADINEQAQQRMDVLVKQMMVVEGMTEELKVSNQMEWVQRINNIRNRAEHIVLQEIVNQ